MGWGCIPDDHELMAGMVGLQTAHRYGNATLLASDMVFGIGNRFANRHTGSVEKSPKGAKSFILILSRRKLVACCVRISVLSLMLKRADTAG